jgi:hypothetical protein
MAFPDVRDVEKTPYTEGSLFSCCQGKQAVYHCFTILSIHLKMVARETGCSLLLFERRFDGFNILTVFIYACFQCGVVLL